MVCRICSGRVNWFWVTSAAGRGSVKLISGLEFENEEC